VTSYRDTHAIPWLSRDHVKAYRNGRDIFIGSSRAFKNSPSF